MRRLMCLAILSVIAAMTALGVAAAKDFDALHSLNSPDYHYLQSEKLGRAFHVFVRLPAGYEETDKTYPTIYLLDGGVTFPLLASYYQYLSMAEEVPNMIVVGVSYGGRSFPEGNYRGTDFTAPAADHDFFGGAEAFQQMFESELLPLVEEKYQADATKRIIFGQSLGGQFALYTALTNPSLFWGHIASNPALHRNLHFFLDDKFQSQTRSTSKVFVSSGEFDDPVYRKPATQWMTHWNNVSDKPWPLKTMTLRGENHFSAAPAAFRQGLKWLFGEE
ncbi:MAG: alpha/beta hydrolase [Hyphococcus sp.]